MTISSRFARNLAAVSAACSAFLLCFSLSSFAQQLPDTIFDDPPKAFGNTLLDVPPDIHDVEIIHGEKPGDSVTVRAVIKTDPILSLYRVTEAKINFFAAGKLGCSDMTLVDEDKRLWEGEIPGMETGTKVKLGFIARDEVGNSVARLIDFSRPVKGAMLDAITDKEDQEIDASIDILSTEFASTGDRLRFCHHFRAPFRWSTFGGAAAVGLGFFPDDVRFNPTHSSIENTHSFVAYFPMIDVKAILKINQVLKGKGAGKEVSMEAKGNRVCGTVNIADLTDKPELGLKFFTGTATFNIDTEEFHLGDSSPYTILYFDALEYTAH